MSAGLRIASAVMAGVFALSVAVQGNDPDPVFWMAIYGLAAALAGLAAADRVPFWPNAAALALFAVLLLLWLPSLAQSRPEAFTSFEMKAPQDEAPRETGGLFLCVLWSAVLTHQARKPKD